MPIDAHLQIRDAGSWDMPFIAELAVTALAAATFGRWSDAYAWRRHAQAQVAGLVHGKASAVTRVVIDDGTIIGAALWTCCAGLASREDVDQPANAHPAEAAWLRTTLMNVHPADAHRHLRLVIVDQGRRRQGIGAALLADPPPNAAPASRYAVLPQTLARHAERAGYQAIAYPIRVPAADIVLQPVWHPGPLRRSPQPPATPPGRPASTQTGAWPW